MANRSILGGSPLGLIGTRSWSGTDGLSTFNGGKSRNVNVNEYNKNITSSKMLYGNSLFTGNRMFRAWPELRETSTGVYDTKGIGDVVYVDEEEDSYNPGGTLRAKGDYSKRRVLHNDSVYDTSVLNILEKLSGTRAALRPADFAYLKNIGVYPNNRLMIARRFASPSDDNIMTRKKDSDLGSIATMISWLPENDNFLDIKFGETWEESKADFKDILNNLGEDDINMEGLGNKLNAGANFLPGPGFTEIFQRRLFASLGIFDDSTKNIIPAGNPNLIKSAKMRKLIGYSEAGSGLKCDISIKMTCEYEMKYISGLDPTLVWMDLLGVITRFGTSNSNGYGLNKNASSKVIGWMNNPNLLIKDVATGLKDALTSTVSDMKDAIDKAFKNGSNENNSNNSENNSKTNRKESINILDTITSTIGNIAISSLDGLLQKYRVRIIGVINALSGLPSTPWHITIGNPMRPTFCSGDMLTQDVNLKLGPTLGFNDLPSSITVEFTLVNARPWGLQEIMSKFNSGYLRTVDVQKTFYETTKVIGDNNLVYNEPVGILPFNDLVYGSDSSPVKSTPDIDDSKVTTDTNLPVSSDGSLSNVSNPESTTREVNGTLPNVGSVDRDAGVGSSSVIIKR